MCHISREVTEKRVIIAYTKQATPSPSQHHHHDDSGPKLQPILFLSLLSDRKLFPPPSSSAPPSAEVGVLREHRACRC